MSAGLRRALGALYDRLPLKPALLRALRPLRPPHALYQHLHFHGVIEVGVGAASFRMAHVAEEIENELFWEGFPGRRERISLALWARLADTAAVIVDVGAHAGVYALVARAVNARARVLAFEPLPELHARLQRNLALNAYDVDAPRLALSDREGRAFMNEWSIGEPRPGAVEVPVRRLDAVLAERGVARVDLMKVDVEGHEPAVLRGLGAQLAACRPTLLLEVLSEAAADELRPLLDGLGYVFYDIDEVTTPRPMPALRKSRHWNVLACRPAVARGLGLPGP